MRSIQLIASLLLATSQLTAAAHELDPALFEGIGEHSDSEVRLRGLAALYPGRVLFDEPILTGNQERSEAARVETIRDEISYIRVYRLEDAIETIEQHLAEPALILDLRYVQSAVLASELSFRLDRAESYKQLTSVGSLPSDTAAALAVEVDSATAVRTSPVVVLCNRETAGPVEALLHNLQTQGAVTAIGEATAGRTGFYKAIDGPIWLLNGEIRPEANTSLVGHGFVPRIKVSLTPQQNYTAYHWYEAGSSLEQILEGMPTEDGELDAREAIDPVLQRGVEIVAALQILQ